MWNMSVNVPKPINQKNQTLRYLQMAEFEDIKKDRPPRMMTSKDDYDDKYLNDYLYELLDEIENEKQYLNKQNKNQKT